MKKNTISSMILSKGKNKVSITGKYKYYPINSYYFYILK